MIPATEEVYLNRFQKKYNALFRNAWSISRSFSGSGLFWFRTMLQQNHLAKRREKLRKEEVHVPPVMICSITNRCNLRCKGCYANAQNRPIKNEISSQRMGRLFDEASELGIGIVLIAGGEPMMREDVLSMAASHKNIIFPVFTNGLLLTGARLDLFRRHKNLIPVLSLEGNKLQTDQRRGKGLHAIIEQRANELKARKQFFGLSITLTRDNVDEVLHPVMMRYYFNQGCKLFFLIEYVPDTVQDQHRCLSDEQKDSITKRINRLRKDFPALFISLPGDEDHYGGCLAAGRGFVHVSSDGKLEPCPFAPYSDTDLNTTSLREALQSTFLENIRNSHHLLSESKGGCTLWENREWVEQQLQGCITASA